MVWVTSNTVPKQGEYTFPIDSDWSVDAIQQVKGA